jgi:hypothetical protein
MDDLDEHLGQVAADWLALALAVTTLAWLAHRWYQRRH